MAPPGRRRLSFSTFIPLAGWSMSVVIVFTADPFVARRLDAPNLAEHEVKQLGPSDNPERREVSSEAIADELRTYAGQRWPRLNHKGRQRELQKLLKLTTRRIKSLYQGERTAVPRGEETERIKALIEERRVAERQAEYRALEARIAQVEALVIAIDEEFGRVHLDAIRTLAFGPRQRSGGGGEGHEPGAGEVTAAE